MTRGGSTYIISKEIKIIWLMLNFKALTLGSSSFTYNHLTTTNHHFEVKFITIH